MNRACLAKAKAWFIRVVSVSDQIILPIIGVFLTVLPFPALGSAQYRVLHPSLSCVAKCQAAAIVLGLCAQRGGDQCKRLGLTVNLQAVAQFAALPHAVGNGRGVFARDAGCALKPMRGFGQGEFGQGTLTFLLGVLVTGQGKAAEYGDDSHDEE